MHPFDLRKLIATFLLLATVVAASAAIFSSFIGNDSSAGIAHRAPAQQSSDAKNAFVESLAQESASAGSGSSAKTDEALSNNLTERLSQMLAAEVLAANPNGPGLAQNGTLDAAAPDPENVAADIDIDALGIQKIIAPRILANKTIDELPQPKILDTYTAEDLTKYSSTLRGITDQAFGNSVVNLLNGPSSKELVHAINLVMNQALLDLQKLPVPKPFNDLHTKFLNLVLRVRNATGMNFESADPMLELTAFQSEMDNLQVAIQDLVSVGNKPISVLNNSEIPATPLTIAHMFTIPIAHAQFGEDIPFLQTIIVNTGITAANTGATTAKIIFDYLKKVATEFVKDQLVHQLVAQTIRWVQGGGKPQFITNWEGFFRDTAKLAIDQGLSEIYPNLCQSFGPLIRVAVLPVNPVQDAFPSCTIDRVIANVQEFAQSFENGGWIAYGAAMDPSNNFFGSLIQVNERLAQLVQSKTEAAKSDAEASHGFLSTRECVKWGDAPTDPVTGLTTGSPPCEEWRNTTPGEVLAGTVRDAMSAPLQRIVNAQDLAALSSALINAALSKLVKLSKNTVSKGLLGVNPTTSSNLNDALGACNGISNPADKANCIQSVCAGLNISPCPGAVPPPSDEGGTCAQENCSPGCYCKGHDQITADNFCFLDSISGAQDSVLAEFQAGASNTGLGEGSECPPGVSPCVLDAGAYKGAVAVKLQAQGLNVNVGEEVCVTGTCGKAVCSLGPKDATCPRPRPAGECLPTTQRVECTKIESSGKAIRKNVPNGICPA